MVRIIGPAESPSNGRSNPFKRFYLSALVTGYALFPPSRQSCELFTLEQPMSLVPHVAMTWRDIRHYLSDINRAADRQGELKLLFSGCLAFAAPALLFRLKRCGFSNCRVLMIKEGLLLSATR